MANSPQKDVIILSRHGKSALSRNIRLTWREYRDWWQKYDAHGLLDGQTPKKRTVAAAAQADIIISSTLRRARESALKVSGRNPDLITPVLVEAALPSPKIFGSIKLRPKSWGTLSRIVWFFGGSDGMETVTDARARAKEAAGLLQDQSAGGKIVFVSAHGWFNRMIGTQLRRKGWRRTENRGDLHWSYRRYERATDIK